MTPHKGAVVRTSDREMWRVTSAGEDKHEVLIVSLTHVLDPWKQIATTADSVTVHEPMPEWTS